MFRALRPSAIKDMEEVGTISLTIKEDWVGVMHGGTTWSAVPASIMYWLSMNSEDIFTCYYSRDRSTLQLTNIEATKLIADKKSLVDAYLYVAIKGVIENARAMRIKNIILDSYIPSITDHMLDLGFRITSKGNFGTPGGRGCKELGD